MVHCGLADFWDFGVAVLDFFNEGSGFFDVYIWVPIGLGIFGDQPVELL